MFIRENIEKKAQMKSIIFLLGYNDNFQYFNVFLSNIFYLLWELSLNFIGLLSVCHCFQLGERERY
jgi:hypothetical protein